MYISNQVELDFPSCSQVKHVVCIEKNNALFYFKSGDYHLIELASSKKVISGKLPRDILEIQHFFDSYIVYFTNNGKFSIFDIFKDPNSSLFQYNLPTVQTAHLIPENNSRLGKSVFGQTFLYKDKDEKALYLIERLIGAGTLVKNVITVFKPFTDKDPTQTVIQEHKFPLNLSLLPLSKKIILWDQYEFDYEILRGPKKNIESVPSFYTGSSQATNLVLSELNILNFDFEEKKNSTIVGVSELSMPNKIAMLENTENHPKIRLICLEKKTCLKTILFPFDSHGLCITNFHSIQSLQNNRNLIFVETESIQSDFSIYTFGIKSYLTSLSWNTPRNDSSLMSYSGDGISIIEIPNHKVVEENAYKSMKIKVAQHKFKRKRFVSLLCLMKLLGMYHIYIIKMCFEMLP